MDVIMKTVNYVIIIKFSLNPVLLFLYFHSITPDIILIILTSINPKINTEFFIEIGSPGGASKVGQTNTDHSVVVALPAKPE